MTNSNLYKDLAKGVFDAMNTRDFSEMQKNITDNLVFDFPGAGKIEGAKRVVLFLTALLRKYSVLKFTVSEVFVEGERACAIWTNKGESKDGKPYANSGVTIFQFDDGKISSMSDYFKDTSFTNTK
jgi:ketosteroid isomerase-like protein